MSAQPSLLSRAFREASVAALVVAVLGFPILAYRAAPDFNNVLTLRARWPLYFTFCALGFALRFVLTLWNGRPRTLKAEVAAAKPAVKRPWLAWLGVAALIAYPLAVTALLGPRPALKWVDTFGVQILLYVLLGWGLNITVGLAGLLDLGYAAFYAVGAYAYALLAPLTGLSFWSLLPVCGMLAALWGVCIGFPILRLRGDYLAIVTLAFAEIVRMVLINWDVVTHGEQGLFNFPHITFFGLPFIPGPRGFDAHFGLHFAAVHKLIFLYFVVLALALLANVVSIRLRRLPLGRAWEALREDEIACRALGLDTANIKLTAFALGAFFAGIAGCLFALRQGVVSPSSFTFNESATILAIVVLGGRGSQWGVALAAVLIVGASELLRQLNFLKMVFGPDFDPAQYRMLLVGLAMVAMMNFRPRGIVSAREPTIKLLPVAEAAE
ncbi:high-affinity branched-chain amino acid ABC transporter permease LivM [Rhodoblastus acidophilus]|uniref:High-affinity branched-chain amino acid ABC transporter permease LivM n=1 Tax=Candidatus Rhodoblastus alkanivorans TaxID=2954117 RepID=A0ABS9Z663_9HYPH|nr:high-affinity branched-chain amino acid ABC transporter permease LivM [Candidatus Rhodoblastus alkanivorans]MCI4678673.1 high-affinity branched-chain amino acid ABC transporter permease LivM [Candidatus Rhodoblastus alkanivorans]MCI4683082.1 high-affinity branched-chain amino acid ABC transporter permease LivM [Candidatus Rhodoblastus alkanivorans]MDI4640393.1 high-affinity branched-chain amino acid ABC transporter permease LivM [Rhodoblastus acidophilus]